jgi:hypothetical protein
MYHLGKLVRGEEDKVSHIYPDYSQIKQLR